MVLKQTIAYYKTANKNGIVEFKEHIPQVHIKEVVEEPLKGNYHISMVTSKDVNSTEEDFVVAALHALEYDTYEISEELSSYNLKEYSCKEFINEVWFSETKEILHKNKIAKENCISVYKLKEKDELTFLIKTNKNYFLLSEIYWRS